MADEIAQVIELEIRGTIYVLRGSIKVLQMLVELIKNNIDKYKDKLLHEPGEHNLADIIALSEGKNIAVVQVPGNNVKHPDGTTDFDMIVNHLEQNGVPFSILPDLNPTDNYMPIAIPPQYADVANSIISSYQKETVEKKTYELNTIDEKIKECRQKIKSLPDGDEKKNEEIRLENLEQARAENKMDIDKINEQINNGAVITYQEYLASGKGTEFERDPELALKKYNEGINISYNFKANEIFQPIRYLETGEETTYYKSPISDVVIERKFQKDKDDIVYSVYSFKSVDGEEIVLTDKNMTASQFEKDVFPQILDKVGLFEDSPIRPFASKEELTSYLQKDAEIKADSDSKIMGKSFDDLSNSSVKEMAEKNLDTAVKQQMYDNTQNCVFINAKLDDLTAVEMGRSVGLKTPYGKVVISSHDTTNVKDGLVIKLKKDTSYTVVSDSDEKRNVNANEVKSMFNVDNINLGRDREHNKTHSNHK